MHIINSVSEINIETPRLNHGKETTTKNNRIYSLKIIHRSKIAATISLSTFFHSDLEVLKLIHKSNHIAMYEEYANFSVRGCWMSDTK